MANEKGCCDSFVVGALGTITATARFENYIESLGIEIRIEHVQKSALLGTARIIRKLVSVHGEVFKDRSRNSATFKMELFPTIGNGNW